MPSQNPAHDYAKDEMLIELVKNRKPLYDMSTKSYRDARTVKRNCWKQILKEMTKSYGPSCTGKYQICN